MKERDKELEALLKPLMRNEPTEEQLHRWTNISRFMPQAQPAKLLLQLATAASIGFLIAMTMYRQPPENNRSVAGNYDSFATLEYIDVKGK